MLPLCSIYRVLEHPANVQWRPSGHRAASAGQLRPAPSHQPGPVILIWPCLPPGGASSECPWEQPHPRHVWPRPTPSYTGVGVSVRGTSRNAPLKATESQNPPHSVWAAMQLFPLSTWRNGGSEGTVVGPAPLRLDTSHAAHEQSRTQTPPVPHTMPGALRHTDFRAPHPPVCLCSRWFSFLLLSPFRPSASPTITVRLSSVF